MMHDVPDLEVERLRHEQARAKERTATARMCLRLSSLLGFALLFTLLYLIWTGDWRPLLTDLVLLGFVGLIAFGNRLPDAAP